MKLYFYFKDGVLAMISEGKNVAPEFIEIEGDETLTPEEQKQKAIQEYKQKSEE